MAIRFKHYEHVFEVYGVNFIKGSSNNGETWSIHCNAEEIFNFDVEKEYFDSIEELRDFHNYHYTSTVELNWVEANELCEKLSKDILINGYFDPLAVEYNGQKLFEAW